MHKFTIKKNEERKIVVDGSGDYIVKLVGAGAKAEILGALLASGREKLAVGISVFHLVPHTFSSVWIRAVGKDSSQIVLSGMIKVVCKAEQSDALLRQNVLLVSDHAQAEVEPKLEIEADKVLVSHAATLGKIDDEQLFYLMSRGLAKAASTKLIIEGFLNEVRDKIKI